MKRIILALILLTAAFLFFSTKSEKPIVVIVPSYNNIRYFKGNIDSILNQSYKNYRVIYVDDCSNDGMGNAVEEYLTEKRVDFSLVLMESQSSEPIEEVTKRFVGKVNEKGKFFTLVRNQNRVGVLANIYKSVLSTKKGE